MNSFGSSFSDLTKLSNKYVSHPMVIAVVSVFIVIYSATIGPELPQSVKDFFSNDYAKFALIFITMWLASAKRPVYRTYIYTGFLLHHQLGC